MKRVLLGIISGILVLASLLGIYAAGIGLEDIPGIERNKNLQAADIEDAVDLIEENLEDYNAYIEQNTEPAVPENEEGVIDPTANPEASPEPSPTPTPTPAGMSAATAQSEYASWRESYNTYRQKATDLQSKYDALAASVAEDDAALNAAREILNAVEAKLNAIPSPDAALAAYNEYRSAEDNYGEYIAFGGDLASVAEERINTAHSAYLAALGSFASIDELQNAYNIASSEVAAARAEVERVEQQLAADQAALQSVKNELDKTNSDAGYSKNRMDNAEAVLSKSQAAESKNESTDADKAREEAEKAAKEAEETAQKLAELEAASDAKEIVEEGIMILLENDDIYSRVVDETDAEEVIDAAREYLEETRNAVSRELGLRSKLYTALKLLSYIGAATGIVGIVVTIVPKMALFIISVVFSSLTAAFAVILNISGMLGGYTHFIYERASGGGNGDLQRMAMLAMLVAAIASVTVVAICFAAFRKALRMRRLKQQVNRMNARAYR